MTMSVVLDASFMDDRIDPSAMSQSLRVTVAELASALGVARESLAKSDRARSRAMQMRLRELVEILGRVEPWAGGPLAAFAWYRSQTLPSFGDMTAEALVRAGRADEVRRYLDRIAAGGFA
jgi:hypothetical protein